MTVRRRIHQRAATVVAFARLAAGYDSWWERQPRLAAAEAAVLRAALVPAASPALEIGAGPGRWAAALKLMVMEPALPLARLARARGCPTVVARAEQLPLRDGCLATAALLTVLEFVSDPAAVAGELRRVVRPGGTLLLALLPRVTRTVRRGRLLRLARPLSAFRVRELLTDNWCRHRRSGYRVTDGTLLPVRGRGDWEVQLWRRRQFDGSD